MSSAATFFVSKSYAPIGACVRLFDVVFSEVWAKCDASFVAEPEGRACDGLLFLLMMWQNPLILALVCWLERSLIEC